MESLIHSYLSANYEIKSTEETSKKISVFCYDAIFYKADDSKIKDPIYGEKLLSELCLIFFIEEAEAKTHVEAWAISINKCVSLDHYWTVKSSRVYSRLIENELISVQPMRGPSGTLFYLDYRYNDNHDLDLTATGTTSIASGGNNLVHTITPVLP